MRRHDLIWGDSFFDPCFERGLHVEGEGARPAAAMRGAGSHEQSIKAIDIRAAAEQFHDALVVIDAVLGGYELIAPAVPVKEFAAPSAELAKIRVGGIHDRPELRL